MRPPFAKEVDPIFSQVLNLLERIASDETLSPEEERATICGLLNQAEGALSQTEEWQLTKYALVCWIDEMLIDAPWEGRSMWLENPLEVQMFNRREANEQFYYKAREAGALTRKDAMEVFYLCVILGFRGLYRNPDAAAVLAPERGLPPTLEAWAKQQSTGIRAGERPPIMSTGRLGPSAPPLDGQALLISASLCTALVAAIIVATIIFFTISVGNTS